MSLTDSSKSNQNGNNGYHLYSPRPDNWYEFVCAWALFNSFDLTGLLEVNWMIPERHQRGSEHHFKPRRLFDPRTPGNQWSALRAVSMHSWTTADLRLNTGTDLISRKGYRSAQAGIDRDLTPVPKPDVFPALHQQPDQSHRNIWAIGAREGNDLLLWRHGLWPLSPRSCA